MLSLFRKNPAEERARALYAEVATHSRHPAFFTTLEAPDTVEGRFEVLCVNMYLVLRRLKSENLAMKDFSQRVFNAFFKNMDDALREMGVGDMSIGRKIRTMAEAFYGRVGAYEKAFDDADALAEAIARNVYAAEDHPRAAAWVDYAKRADDTLSNQDDAALMSGAITFPAVSAAV
ncbi:MAG: ubiquinol-cytochrome C chaperone family protein [Pseudomonadota bacterium]